MRRRYSARETTITVLAFALLGLASACAPTPDDDRAEPITSWNGVTLNDYQLNLVADGTVSDADLADAYERAAECASADGWQVSVIPAVPMGLALNVTYGPNDDGEAAAQKVGECEDEWVGPLGSMYMALSAPTGAERELAFTKWQECMVSNGAVIEGVRLGQSQSDMIALLQDLNARTYPEWDASWQDCIDTYYAVLWPDMFGAP